MGNKAYEPARWLRDLIRFIPLKSQFVLSGNVSDLQINEVAPGFVTSQSLNQVLSDTLRALGYVHTLLYQPILGFSSLVAHNEGADDHDSILSKLGLNSTPDAINNETLTSAIERLVNFQGDPCALIIDYASRLLVRNNNLTPPENALFTQALMLSQKARSRPSGPHKTPLFNTIIWIVEREGDIPDWFLVANPRVRHIPISKPDNVSRRALTPGLLRSLPGFDIATSEDREKAEDAFVEGTEGLLFLDMNAIAVLSRVENLSLMNISDAVRRYKVGVTEDPWLRIDREKIRSGEDFVRQRVKGQSVAVTHMLDIVKRAMTGVGNSKRGSRPRGVAFLAGPTGVGKTELAKTITSLLFGDEDAYIRFDMSEFSAEHSDQRLVGAPPGYVGYDAGGELTNAIREKPFSVVLFDEIEKAHPRVLDKFLQILDDGVLTSGRGDRVYFSEALIIFTSNLGIYKMGNDGTRTLNVSADEAYEEVARKVHLEIENHFKLVLNRPEILNRIGENIIVFDFIRIEIATQIFEQMVNSLLSDLRTQGIEISISKEAKERLLNICLEDLSNGGRGIRNQMEAHLLNPLSRNLFDIDAKAGQSYVIEELGPSYLTLKSNL